METHAQHLHKAPSHGLKHYLFEFLMLFLAVFAGFLAENRREHYVEKERAKIFAKNLYQDLKKDTSELNDVIEGSESTICKLDSLCFLLSNRNKESTTGLLNYYASYTPSIYFFSSTNTTIEQLKNSGNLRIMDNELSEKISEYGNRLNLMENEYRLTRSEFEKMETLYFKIFDVHQRYVEIPHRDSLSRDSISKINIPLANDDPKLIKEFMGWTKFNSRIYDLYNHRYHVPMKIFVTDLIALIGKKYDLD